MLPRFKMSFRSSRMLTGYLLVSVTGCMLYVMYRRLVLWDPMRLVKAEDGSLRWMTRMEGIEERLGKTRKALQLDPANKERQREVAVMMVVKMQEERAMREAGTLPPKRITNDDLTV